MDRIILIADDGKVYTNGSTYGVEVYLAIGESPSNWWEITNEEYEALQQEENF